MILLLGKLKQRRLYIAIVVSISLAIVLTCGCSPNKSDASADRIYSHRGTAREEEEHTFDAYDLAILYGSKNIELDIVYSSEKTPYVSHDKTAEKMFEVDKLFSDMSDEEIDGLVSKKGNHPLKMSDVFDRYGDIVNYVIELKEPNLEIVDAFSGVIDKYSMTDNVIVQCFDQSKLEALEEIYPEMPKMFLCKEQEVFDSALGLDYVDIICVEKALMNSENLSLCHEGGKEFSVYTLNSMEEIQKAIDLNVDSYFTDYTGKALALEKQAQ